MTSPRDSDIASIPREPQHIVRITAGERQYDVKLPIAAKDDAAITAITTDLNTAIADIVDRHDPLPGHLMMALAISALCAALGTANNELGVAALTTTFAAVVTATNDIAAPIS